VRCNEIQGAQGVENAVATSLASGRNADGSDARYFFADVTLYKKRTNKPNRRTTDKCALEHIGQLIRIGVEKLANTAKQNIAWKKVKWNKVGDDLKTIDVEQEDIWGEIRKIVDKLRKVVEVRKINKWWMKEMENMSRDMKRMRRKGDDSWKLVRKILRNIMLTKRYEKMKEELGNMKDPEIFKAIKTLEGKRAIHLITLEDGTRVLDHETMSDLIADQLDPSQEHQKDPKATMEMIVSKEEIDNGLKTSRTNMANGIDQISYPFLRFWKGEKTESFMKVTRRLINEECEE